MSVSRIFSVSLTLALWSSALCFQHMVMKFETSNVPISPKDGQYNHARTALLGSGLLVSSLFVRKSEARTFFDTDFYGDKELKIATVNKLKQKLRNEILANPSLAVGFLKLAINDALGYSIDTKDGGADGSILFELDKMENAGLDKSFYAMQKIQNELKRTNTLSFADVCSFAGGEALESVGCGRVIVQIGRFDAKDKNAKPTYINWKASESSASSSGSDPMQAFKESGVDIRDALVLLSAIGEIDRVVKVTLDDQARDVNDEEDDSFEAQPFVPSTFGSRDAIFGAKVGKADFGVEYVTKLLNGKVDASKDMIGRLILSQANAKSILSKYNGNEAAYKKDVGDAYTRISQIGEAYTTRNS